MHKHGWRTAVGTALSLALAAAGTVTLSDPAHAAANRIRLGSSADVTRPAWSGPAFTMNGDGGVVTASMARALDSIRAGSGTLDVVVLAGSAPTSGSKSPECDTVMTLSGVNSCTTWTLTSATDGNNNQVNSDVRNAEFVYFAGGDQCRYAGWKGTALEASVESVVAKGGGAGGGSAGHHINSPVVYDACNGSVTSAEALADPYKRSISFTTGMFEWNHYAGIVNDSHFVTRDRMGRTMTFVARALQDGLTTGGRAWAVGVEEGGGSLYIDGNGLATLYGKDAYVILGDHLPERATARRPLTYQGFKIWHLTPGQTFDFRNRPDCGYYLRSVVNGVADANLYHGTPQTTCGSGGGTTFGETEPNDTTSTADDASTSASAFTVTGALTEADDRDHYRLTLPESRTLNVDCAVPDAYDADAYLLNSSGSTLERSVNAGAGADESLTLTRTASGTGTYYLDVEAYSGSGTAPYTCTHNVS